MLCFVLNAGLVWFGCKVKWETVLFLYVGSVERMLGGTLVEFYRLENLNRQLIAAISLPCAKRALES